MSVFVKEWATPTSDDARPLLDFCADHPQMASAVPFAAAHDGPEWVSVRVREHHQCRTDLLPSGARTMLCSRSSKRIVLRGINKFPDWHEVADQELLGAAANDDTQIYLQRKLAGFIVHVFSTDGTTLTVATKHSISGPHVGIATQILERQLPSSTLSTLANLLFTRNLALSGECVASVEDKFHPVVDARFDDAIHFFGLRRRDTVAELGVPFAELIQLAGRLGLPLVPTVRFFGEVAVLLSGATDVALTAPGSRSHTDAVARLRGIGCSVVAGGAWEAWWPIGEGFVALVERKIPPASGPALPTGLIWPWRVKIKAVGYILRRSLRGWLQQTSHPPRVIATSPYAEALASYLRSGRTSLDSLRKRLESGDTTLATLMDEFEATLAEEARCSLTNAVGQALRSTLSGRHHVVMLCGMPGSGKSTWASSALAAAKSAGEVISRDALSASIASATDTGSKRRIGKLLHRQLRGVLERALSRGGTMMIVLDAVHASAAARKFWLASIPERHDVTVVYLDERRPSILAARVAGRQDHCTVKPEAAQEVVFSIGRVFEPPTAVEVDQARHGTQLLHCASPGEAVDFVKRLRLRARASPWADEHAVDHLRGVDAGAIEYASIEPEPESSADWRVSVIDHVNAAIDDADRRDAVAGHTRWLKPFLTQGNAADANEGLRRLFGQPDGLCTLPHVTIFHQRDDVAVDVDMELLEALDGERVPLVLGDVWVDRNAVCVCVRSPDLDEWAAARSIARAFWHVTVGTRRGTDPAYCADFPTKQAAYEAQLSASRKPKAHRAEQPTSKNAPAPSFCVLSGRKSDNTVVGVVKLRRKS